MNTILNIEIEVNKLLSFSLVTNKEWDSIHENAIVALVEDIDEKDIFYLHI